MTIETLTPGFMSVVSVGDSARDFSSVHRVLQRLLTKMPAIYDCLNTGDILDILRSARDRATDVDFVMPTASGPHLLKVRPVYGPTGAVHAVRLWLGPADVPIPELRPAVGGIWDLDAQTVAQPSGITRLCGVAAEEYVPRMSLAELFQRIPMFDRHAELLDLLYDPRAGDRFQHDVVVVFASARPALWRVTICARDEDGQRGAWLLFEQIRSDNLPPVCPTLERVGLREAHRRAGTYLAIVQLAHTSITHWLTDPAPWVRWDYLFRPVDVFHPEDRGRLIELAHGPRTGDTTRITVRVLNYAGEYTPTSMLLYPYPGFSNRELSIAQFVRVADSVASLDLTRNELASNRQPQIGYDEQLRHSLACRIK
ncbi:GAF domain-containing protein [Nocardia iowensis]|uniref:DUF5593 domain-containing protein n=1 Tax=Nocardia iowensis TaxID=204891 RepID=A0ABX8RZE2_NOCIO|nr:GAF domain-containing protein [Nocardia iowensis]QXN94646.1 DUF5593 domain-containing protein [Nocardia iowensis]